MVEGTETSSSNSHIVHRSSSGEVHAWVWHLPLITRHLGVVAELEALRSPLIRYINVISTPVAGVRVKIFAG